MKIPLGLFARSSFHMSSDTHLTLQRHPVKRERRTWIRFELFPLVAGIIRKKNKTPFIETFEQHDADGWRAVGCCRGQAHRIRIANSGIGGIGKPNRELTDRIGIEISATESLRRIIEAQTRNVDWRSVHTDQANLQSCERKGNISHSVVRSQSERF